MPQIETAMRPTSSEPQRLYPKETAVILRRILKAAFPGTRFSVTTSRGAGVSSVDVRWTDGPTVAEVRPHLAPFKAGRFDGMTDSYEYDRDRTVTVDGVTYEPCCKYVDASRTISAALANRCIARLAAFWGGIENPPTAEVDRWGSMILMPEGSAGRMIRDDFGGWQHEYTWHMQVHRCAEEPGKYVRAIADIDIDAEAHNYGRCEACDPENMGYECQCDPSAEDPFNTAAADAADISDTFTSEV